MHASFRTAALCLLPLLVGGAPQGPVLQASTPKVLIVAVDGLRADAPADMETPYLDVLRAGGAYTAVARTSDDGSDEAGWPTLLTGVWAAKHGAAQDVSGYRAEAYPDVLTRIEAVRPDAGTLAAVDWRPLVDGAGGAPLLSARVDELLYFDADSAGYARADADLVVEASLRLWGSDVDAAFVYLGNPGAVASDFGADSEEYALAVQQVDADVGTLMAALRARASFASEDWLVLVATSFPEGGASLLVSGPSTLEGTFTTAPALVDVAATALAHLGLATDPAWNLDG